MDNYDFSGYATKNNLKCTDGRTILQDAFKESDGEEVPLVWHHLHKSVDNVLGLAHLENREDGVYAYCSFNSTTAGQNAKLLVQHGDIKFLSIYANDLVEKGKSVLHGMIREVSLVMAGANPGAKIDNLSIAHEDGSDPDEIEDEAYIWTGEKISLPEQKPEPVLEHAAAKVTPPAAPVVPADQNPADAGTGETVQDVWNTLTPKQLNVVFAVIAETVDAATGASGDTAAQSAINDDEGDESEMKKNVFDNTDTEVTSRPRAYLTHDQFQEIVEDAKKIGSFKQSFLMHVDEYGFDHPEYLFPDARANAGSPVMIQRKMEWVTYFMANTYHSPFSRVKTVIADITADEARAKGYVKAAKKTDEIIKLLRRSTQPTTVYKKAKLDRDDIIDITDLDIVVWQKAEMRVMLDEEIARAALISDDRATESPDKINEEGIRPIYKDDEMYAVRVRVPAVADPSDVIDLIIGAMADYYGTGTPAMFTTPGFLSKMLLLRDTEGHRLYKNQGELESELGVSKIVPVQVMGGVERTTDESPAVDLSLLAILVNPKDYTFGADKGGEVNTFDNFDIDYNQQKFLIEARCSGALTLPHSAIVVEQIVE